MPKKRRETPEMQLRHVADALVEDLDASGAGIVHAVLPDGGTIEVLAPGAVPGERIALDWRPPLPGGRRGLAEGFTVLAPSPDTDPSRCPLAGTCGGCPAGRLDYARELALKTERLVVAPLAGAGVTPEHILPARGQPEDRRQGFRNKAVLYPGIIDGRPRFGYFRARSQDLVAAEDCPQTPAWMGEAARRAAPLLLRADLAPWHEADDKGALRALLLREAPGTGERLVTLVLRRLPDAPEAREALFDRIREALSPARPDALLVNRHERPGSAVLSLEADATFVLSGRSGIEARLMNLAFTLGAGTFLQVNTPQTPVLYGIAIDALRLSPEDRVLDLYCGVGTLTLLAARKVRSALGIERVAASVECARENARRNGLGNAAFLAAPVEKALTALPEDFLPTKIIVDPAYQGLGGGAAEALAALVRRAGVQRLVYVSCNPKSFARDAAVLARAGLAPRSVTPVDMFPGAMHLEVVGVFETPQT